MSRRRQVVATPADQPPRNNPFGTLQASAFPTAPRPPTPPAAPSPSPSPPPAVPHRGRLQLRLENRRRGKVVTVVHGFAQTAEEEVMTLAASLRRELGVGGLASAGGLELQGDQRRRAAAWLVAAGYRVTGNLD